MEKIFLEDDLPVAIELDRDKKKLSAANLLFQI